MFDWLTYKHILAMVILVALAWIVLILFRVGRWHAILNVDFLKSKWRIVLFWFVIAGLAVFILWLLNKFGFISNSANG